MKTSLNTNPDESREPIDEETGEPENVENDDQSFKIENGNIYEVVGKKLIIIANFELLIKARNLLIDDGTVIDHLLDLELNFQSKTDMLRLTAQEFYSGNFMPKIWSKVGTGAILYGAKKKLVIAIQELSDAVIPVRQVLSSHGFTADGHYLSPSIKITPEGIFPMKDIGFDLTGGNFSQKIGFLLADPDVTKKLLHHIYNDFLNLKHHNVTYTLMGHVCLALFSSVIAGEMGLKKPALHLEGPSGGGKTMLASLAMSFFGDFRDHFMSWTSTANAIEREGFFFRDALFLIDDLKNSVISPETVIRTLQNYVDGHGRARMKSNTSLQKQFYIRGLLLSTGEDFIDDMESVNGRTILLNVEPEKNTAAGHLCLENRESYRCFIPLLIKQVISQPDWKKQLRDLINQKSAEFHALTEGLPNGLRISLNWALNCAGFSYFVSVIEKYKIINKTQAKSMLAEYNEIAKSHIGKQAAELQQKNPAEMMFRVLQQKIQANQAAVVNLSGTTGKGKIIGTVPDNKEVVYLYPDLVMELLQAHFHKMPFSKKALTEALAREGLISRSENGRWTRQVREQNKKQIRSNVWEIELKLFMANCGLNGSENNEQNQGKEG